MKPILIIKAGTTLPRTKDAFGDFEDWIVKGTGLTWDQVQVVSACQSGPLPDPLTSSGVIVTGSHSMVTDHEPWCEELARWIPYAIDREIPFLSICFGHQLLAYAMGGEAGDHPQGREVGTVEIHLNDEGIADPLLGTLPPCFLGHVVHKQSALRLPPGAVRLAGNAYEPHHAFRIGCHTWGVQFHPEFDAAIMRSCVTEQSQELEAEGLDVTSILSCIKETPEASLILARFAGIARGRNDTMSSHGGNT